MPHRVDYEKLSVFEQVKLGLEQAIAHSRGQINLKTTTLVRPRPPASRGKAVAPRKKVR